MESRLAEITTNIAQIQIKLDALALACQPQLTTASTTEELVLQTPGDKFYSICCPICQKKWQRLYGLIPHLQNHGLGIRTLAQVVDVCGVELPAPVTGPNVLLVPREKIHSRKSNAMSGVLSLQLKRRKQA